VFLIFGVCVANGLVQTLFFDRGLSRPSPALSRSPDFDRTYRHEIEMGSPLLPSDHPPPNISSSHVGKRPPDLPRNSFKRARPFTIFFSSLAPSDRDSLTRATQPPPLGSSCFSAPFPLSLDGQHMCYLAENPLCRNVLPPSSEPPLSFFFLQNSLSLSTHIRKAVRFSKPLTFLISAN